MARERLDVKQAAQILGISTDAVHKRVKRGSLTSDKDPDGRVFVYLDEDLDNGYTRPATSIQRQTAPCATSWSTSYATGSGISKRSRSEKMRSSCAWPNASTS
jgi:hypothetical protein